MQDTQLEQLALIDLGLLTRVVCHELNNVIATQRGYARLLTQRGASGEDGARWLGELTGASAQLQSLVSGVQEWTRRQEHSVRTADVTAGSWPPGPTLATRVQTLVEGGAGLSAVALGRLMMIVAGEAAASPDTWSVPKRTLVPVEGALFGTCADHAEILLTTIADASNGATWGDWTVAAERILPAAGSTPSDWARSLALGLLRQAGADLYHLSARPGQSSSYALALPAPSAQTDQTGVGHQVGIQSD
jgi:hypothetical protein